MGIDLRYGRKARRKLSEPKIKKHRLQNVQNKQVIYIITMVIR